MRASHLTIAGWAAAAMIVLAAAPAHAAMETFSVDGLTFGTAPGDVTVTGTFEFDTTTDQFGTVNIQVSGCGVGAITCDDGSYTNGGFAGSGDYSLSNDGTSFYSAPYSYNGGYLYFLQLTDTNTGDTDTTGYTVLDLATTQLLGSSPSVSLLPSQTYIMYYYDEYPNGSGSSGAPESGTASIDLVPEPASLGLLALATGVIAPLRRRRKRVAA